MITAALLLALSTPQIDIVTRRFPVAEPAEAWTWLDDTTYAQLYIDAFYNAWCKTPFDLQELPDGVNVRLFIYSKFPDACFEFKYPIWPAHDRRMGSWEVRDEDSRKAG